MAGLGFFADGGRSFDLAVGCDVGGDGGRIALLAPVDLLQGVGGIGLHLDDAGGGPSTLRPNVGHEVVAGVGLADDEVFVAGVAVVEGQGVAAAGEDFAGDFELDGFDGVGFSGGGVAGFAEELVEAGAVVVFAAEEDGVDLFCVLDVGQRVGADEYERGVFAFLDRTETVGDAEELCGDEGGGFQDFGGGDAGVLKEGHLVVERGAGEDVGVGEVGAADERNAGAVKLGDHLLHEGNAAAGELAEIAVLSAFPEFCHRGANVLHAAVFLRLRVAHATDALEDDERGAVDHAGIAGEL